MDGTEGAPDSGVTTVNSLRRTPVLVPSTNAHSFPSRRWTLCTRLGVSNWSTPSLVHCTRSPVPALFGSIVALLNSGSMRSSGSLTGLAIPTLHECPTFRLVAPRDRFAAWRAQRSDIGPPRRRRRPHIEVHDAGACTPTVPGWRSTAAVYRGSSRRAHGGVCGLSKVTPLDMRPDNANSRRYAPASPAEGTLSRSPPLAPPRTPDRHQEHQRHEDPRQQRKLVDARHRIALIAPQPDPVRAAGGAGRAAPSGARRDFVVCAKSHIPGIGGLL